MDMVKVTKINDSYKFIFSKFMFKESFLIDAKSDKHIEQSLIFISGLFSSFLFI